jgi:phosphatidylserine/phosphatidylglycerophosphate/cardiolipin synthase-like enzyme
VPTPSVLSRCGPDLPRRLRRKLHRRLQRGLALLPCLAAPLFSLQGAGVPHPASQEAAPRTPALELVETAPVETVLDHLGIRNADQVWLEMIGGARKSLDFGQFYVSSQPTGRLEPVLAALESAGGRGVRIRFLLDKQFTATYPEDLARLKRVQGLELRVLDLSATTRGVLHAKYFVVDGEELYLGSQNFDWRSLEHIQELGVRVVAPEIARAVNDVFAFDWTLAANPGGGLKPGPPARPYAFPASFGSGAALVRASLTVAPEPFLCDPATFELPKLVELIDSARKTLRVQVMTYKTLGRDKVYFDELDAALRRAAARGVKVELLCADWSKRKGTIEGLQSLEPLDNVEVRLTTLPQWSGGYIPFARVCHAKYLVVDGARGWIGTSNWERDYFLSSRNLGLVVEGAPIAAELEQFFASTWNSPYAAPVDPGAKYEAPKFGDK